LGKNRVEKFKIGGKIGSEFEIWEESGKEILIWETK
jgi:hypothetical protein